MLFANYGLIACIGIAALIGIITHRKLGASKITNLTLGYALGFLSWLVGLWTYTYA